jgi:hypothetical protein
MKKTIYWLALNAGFAAAVWFGFWSDTAGARYLAQFYVFALALPISILINSDSVVAAIAKEKPAPVRAAISRIITWAALVTFVWHGYIFTAIAWALSMLLAAVARHAASTRRKAEGAAA